VVLDRFKIRRTPAIALGVILLVGGVTAVALTARHQPETTSTASASPTVVVVRPERTAADALSLPVRLAPHNLAQIHARTAGYIDRWYVDIGQAVTAGQMLARLNAPELDQQIGQATADLQTAQANLAIASSTAERWALLFEKDLVARQAYEERTAARDAALSMRDSAAANVARLRTLQGYTRIRAPFAGVITDRQAQVGALVNAGATTEPLFTLADIRQLRIVAHVPQRQIGQLNEGLQANLTLPEYPGQTFSAVLARSSGAIEPQSGAMRVEFVVDNSDGRLRPGSYGNLQLSKPPLGEGLMVPGSSLISTRGATQVAVVTAQGRVDLRPVKVGRDNGQTVEIVDGLTPADRVILTPSDGVRQGEAVTPRLRPASRRAEATAG
jgi:RND family efflux transporter MFP subunit